MVSAIVSMVSMRKFAATIFRSRPSKEGVPLTLVGESVQNRESLKSTALPTRQSILANPHSFCEEKIGFERCSNEAK